MNVLVVDDEPSVRKSIALLLKFAGHAAEAVGDCETALALVAERPFELVMTDFSMPGTRGDELVRHIRQLRPGQKIIMATAYVDESMVLKHTSGGVDGLLFKPFSLEDLKNEIARVMGHTCSSEVAKVPISSGG